MKQIWQADDGELFDTEKECKEYEAEEKRLNALEELILPKLDRYEVGVRDVLIALSETHDVVPK